MKLSGISIANQKLKFFVLLTKNEYFMLTRKETMVFLENRGVAIKM